MTSGWEEATAIGTITLAAVTAWLAASTRRLAREAGAETRANWMPVLVPDPDVAIRMNGEHLELPLRNIGRGPALTVTALLWEERGADQFAKTFRGQAASDAVAPGGRIVFQWRDFKSPPLPEIEGINVWSQLEGGISYGDVAYARYDTELEVGFRGDRVVKVLDHRFLGAARDRISGSDRIRWRVVAYFTSRDRGPAGGLRGRIMHRLTRLVVKRLSRDSGPR